MCTRKASEVEEIDPHFFASVSKTTNDGDLDYSSIQVDESFVTSKNKKDINAEQQYLKFRFLHRDENGIIVFRPTCPVCNEKFVPFLPKIGESFGYRRNQNPKYFACPNCIATNSKGESQGMLVSWAHCKIIIDENVADYFNFKRQNTDGEIYIPKHCPLHKTTNLTCLTRLICHGIDLNNSMHPIMIKLRPLIKQLEEHVENKDFDDPILRQKMTNIDVLIGTGINIMAQEQNEKLKTEQEKKNVATRATANRRRTLPEKASPQFTNIQDQLNIHFRLSIVTKQHAPSFGRWIMWCTFANCSTMQFLHNVELNGPLIRSVVVPNDLKYSSLPNDWNLIPSYTENALPLSLIDSRGWRDLVAPCELAMTYILRDSVNGPTSQTAQIIASGGTIGVENRYLAFEKLLDNLE